MNVLADREREDLLECDLVVRDCLAMARSSQQARFQYVPHEDNRVAHALARYACTLEEEAVWLEEILD